MRKSYSKLVIKKEEVAQEPSRPTTRLESKRLSKVGKLVIKSENTSPRHEYKQEVAIKVLSKKKITEKEQSYLQEELAILKSLDHPNIVKFIDFFEDDSHFCIVMELLQGGALFDSIIEQQKNVSNSFSEPEVRDAIMSLADAMAYYHNMGVVHRDIKPSNLLIGPNGIILCDFGQCRVALDSIDSDEARQMAEKVQLTLEVGSRWYKSPE